MISIDTFEPVATIGSTKRKLSTSSTTAPITDSSLKKVVKKPKTSDNVSRAGTEVDPAGSEEEIESVVKEKDEDAGEGSSKEDRMRDEDFEAYCERSKRLEGDGPFKFLISSEALADLDENPLPVFFIPEVERMFKKLSDLPEEERGEAADEMSNAHIRIADMEKVETGPGEKLKNKWEEIEEDWCQATFVKKPSKNGKFRLKFEPESDELEGCWWMTDIERPTKTALEAINFVSEFMTSGLDGF